MQEFYDSRHNLFRLDLYYDGSVGGEAGAYQIIHDFDTQVEYIINRYTSTCSSSQLGTIDSGGDYRTDNMGNEVLLSPSEILYLGNQFDYSYEGVTTVRGVEVDAWISVRNVHQFESGNLTDAVFEFFFTRPDYTVSTDRSSGEVSIPWRITIRGTASYTLTNFTANTTELVNREVDAVIDFFDFSSMEPPYDAYDVSLCSSEDETHTMVFAFNTSQAGIDFGRFRSNLRAAVVQATGIKPLQVNNIQVRQ